jgi:hypothetical protein
MVETANPKVMAALENKIAKLADEKLLLTDKLSQSNNPNGTLDEIIKLLRNYPAIHWNVCENGSLLVKKVILKTAFAAPLIEPPPLKWSDPIVRKTEDQRWPLRDPSLKRLS